MKIFSVLLASLLLCFSLIGLAQQVTYDGHEFDTEQQRKIYAELISELRCPKCQNQNIADSNAPLAADMRERSYEMVMAGQSKQAVIDHMVARYGNFAHYKPPFNVFTAILWIAPIMIGLFGIVIAIRLSRKRNEPVALTAQEERELARLKGEANDD